MFQFSVACQRQRSPLWLLLLLLPSLLQQSSSSIRVSSTNVTEIKSATLKREQRSLRSSSKTAVLRSTKIRLRNATTSSHQNSSECFLICRPTPRHSLWSSSSRRAHRDKTTDRWSCIKKSELSFPRHREVYRLELPPQLLLILSREEASVLQPEENMNQNGHFCIKQDFLVNGSDVIRFPDHLTELPWITESPITAISRNKWAHNTSHHHFSQRHLSVTVGIKTLLGIRVTTTSGLEPAESLMDIRWALFGVGKSGGFLGGGASDAPASTTTQILAQMTDCSGGQLQFVPPTITTATSMGAIDIVVNMENITHVDVERRSFQRRILEAATEELGKANMESIDHILFSLPPGGVLDNDENWIAFGYTKDPYSYFQDSWILQRAAVMHELGHSIGFAHSGKGEEEYGDESGTMGFVMADSEGFSFRCFNGHKNWIAGWFTNRTLSFHPSRKSEGAGLRQDLRLVTFVDYRKGSYLLGKPTEGGNSGDFGFDDRDETDHGYAVIVRVGDLYIQYNRAKEFNRETFTNRDKVTVTTAKTDSSISWSLAGLGKGESFHYINRVASKSPIGSGDQPTERHTNVTIHVCDLITVDHPNQARGGEPAIDYAWVILFLDQDLPPNPCRIQDASFVGAAEHSQTPTSTMKPTTPPQRVPYHEHPYSIVKRPKIDERQNKVLRLELSEEEDSQHVNGN